MICMKAFRCNGFVNFANDMPESENGFGKINHRNEILLYSCEKLSPQGKQLKQKRRGMDCERACVSTAPFWSLSPISEATADLH